MNNTLKITLVAMFAITAVVLIGTLIHPVAGVVVTIPAGVGVMLFRRSVLGLDKQFGE